MLFSPDGKSLLTTAYGQARLWGLTTGKPGGELKGASSRGHRAAFSPDGKWLAVAGDDHVVRLHRWPALEEVRSLPRHPDRLRDPAFATQAGMSVLDPSSLDRTSITSPTAPSRIAPIRLISGPGHGMPRASIERVMSVAVVIVDPSFR